MIQHRSPGSKLEPHALEGHLTGFIGKSLIRVYIPSKRRVNVFRIGNVRFVPADYQPSTTIEIDAPASTSNSNATKQPIEQSTEQSTKQSTLLLVESPDSSLSPPSESLPSNMPGSFEDDDYITSMVDFKASSPDMQLPPVPLEDKPSSLSSQRPQYSSHYIVPQIPNELEDPQSILDELAEME